MSGRRRLAPEVIQTSQMDCGPASLTCLLGGFGIEASYGRLREACQTSVDGTSIDVLEEVANELGLVAEQVMIPRDHLLLAEAEATPALVVVQNPDGAAHFVVVWGELGGRVQVMDPAVGRGFPTRRALLQRLFPHTMAVPAAGFEEYARSAEFLRPLRARVARLGAPGEPLLAQAVAEPGPRALATLDAATRLCEALIEAGGLDRGPSAARLCEALYAEELARPSPPPRAIADFGGDPGAPIPPTYWTVWPAEPDDDGDRLWLRGAVVLRIRGARPAAERTAPASPELRRALDEAPPRPARMLWSLVRGDGPLAVPTLLAALLLAGAGSLLAAVLFRSLFEAGASLGVARQRLGAAAALVLFLAALLAVEVPIAAGLLRLGRHLEARLRLAFLAKIPRLGDRYFQSRPTSDMVQRGHAIQLLRTLPLLAGRLARSVVALVLTSAGLIWLDPRGAPLVLGVAALSLATPLLLSPLLAERDLRVRSQGGALTTFYLDALLGLVPLRAHAAERSLRREHEGVLAAFTRAGLDLYRAALGVEAAQALLGFGCAAALVAGHLGRAADPSRALLLLYWAINLPAIGEEIAAAARSYPAARNVLLRVLEPLGAIEDAEAGAPVPQAAAPDRPASVQLQGARVVAGGHTLLDGVDLAIAPGEHLAVVGPSGAGKSTLAGLLLGWHRAEQGAVLVDGEPLAGARLAALREATVWVDPTVQLWNRALRDNLVYGARDARTPMLRVIDQADLQGLLETLPRGLSTPLGEGGALVSGGEGQRVRFGRGVRRGRARLVILDEPFRGLDHATRRALLDRAREVWKDATLICITHDLAETRAFPRALVIEGGRVVEDGAPAELLAGASRYRALVEAEAEARDRLWGSGAWRRLRLANGRLQVEEP